MITSTSSNQVKNVINLQKKSKARKDSLSFVVEGIKMVLEAPKDRIIKVYVQESFDKDNANLIQQLNLPQDRIETVSDNVFMKMSDTKTPQGIMAVVSMNKWDTAHADNIDENALLICVENLQDPGNLGTIVRMGEAAGVTGIIMSSNTVDLYNPKTIRSTMGSIYRVPCAYVTDFEGTLDELKKKGVRLYAAHLDGKCIYTDCDYRQATAFLIGNEGNGLTESAASKADSLIIIPMEGSVESLNAAIACTVLTFEAARQRRK